MYQKEFINKDLSNSTFLITGGAGFIGSHIVEYLLKHGAGKVRVLDNLITGRESNIEAFQSNDRFEFLNGDIRNLEDCQKACEGVDYVSHQAALGSVPRSVKDPIASNSHNVDGFLNMLHSAKEANVKTFVYASSSSVYGDDKVLPKKEGNEGNPLSPYAVTKKTNELYAKVFHDVYGFNILGLRYFNIFGPRQDPNGQYAAVIPLFVSKCLEGEEVMIDGDGEQTRDFTFVANAVKANVLALLNSKEESYGKVYNIAVGQNYSVNYLYEKIASYLEVESSAKHREARKGDIRNSLADISNAEASFGYQPEVSFEDGLPITIDYFKSLFLKQ